MTQIDTVAQRLQYHQQPRVRGRKKIAVTLVEAARQSRESEGFQGRPELRKALSEILGPIAEAVVGFGRLEASITDAQ